ncbi:MAG: outer membrane beta-barrel protein [Gammaproteobacteria bacterium]|nr:outer membrane beta-barrel protein [Gammaproteobacteria bacterium]
MKKIVISSLVAISMMGTAFADVSAQSGLYVNGQAGYSFADSPDYTSTLASNYGNYSYSQSDNNYVLGATVGYDYALTQNWMTGLELGYLYMGETTYNYTIPHVVNVSGSISNWGIQLMATGTYVMSSGWNFFGKVGGVYESTDVSGSASGSLSSGSTDQTGVLPALAIGMGYLFTQNLNLSLQYEHTFGSNWNDNNVSSDSSPMTQNILTLGLTYKFPL